MSGGARRGAAGEASSPAARAYRLVVFDWDGTLIDSIGSIVECTRCALADVGVAMPPVGSIRSAIGLGLEDTFQRYYPHLSAETRALVMQRYAHHWVETWHARHDPFPAAGDVLRGLSAAGRLLGLATAKSRRGLVRDFARTGLGAHFHATRTVDECPPKPSPAMLLELMDELGARPAETLMVGDSRWDLEMARNAGVDSVAVLGGAEVEAELRGYGPLACLPGVEELAGWLGLARDARARGLAAETR
jgi:phosphoglycolate phosphatase